RAGGEIVLRTQRGSEEGRDVQQVSSARAAFTRRAFVRAVGGPGLRRAGKPLIRVPLVAAVRGQGALRQRFSGDPEGRAALSTSRGLAPLTRVRQRAADSPAQDA